MSFERVLIYAAIAIAIVVSMAIGCMHWVAKRREMRERRDARSLKIAAEREFEATHKKHA